MWPFSKPRWTGVEYYLRNEKKFDALTRTLNAVLEKQDIPLDLWYGRTCQRLALKEGKGCRITCEAETGDADSYLWVLATRCTYKGDGLCLVVEVWRPRIIHLFATAEFCVAVRGSGARWPVLLSEIKESCAGGMTRRQFLQGLTKKGALFSIIPLGANVGAVKQQGLHPSDKKLQRAAEHWFRKVQELYGIRTVNWRVEASYSVFAFGWMKGGEMEYDAERGVAMIRMGRPAYQFSKILAERAVVHEAAHAVSHPFLTSSTNSCFHELVSLAAEALLKPSVFFSMLDLSSRFLEAHLQYVYRLSKQPSRYYESFFLCIYILRSYGFENMKAILRELILNHQEYNSKGGPTYAENRAVIDCIASRLGIRRGNHEPELLAAFTKANARYAATGVGLLYVVRYLEKCAFGDSVNRRTFFKEFTEVTAAASLTLLVPPTLLDSTEVLE